jgi:hypothetical protein
MDNITLSLSLQQVNIIFASLAKMPYESVAQIINDLNVQIEPQVSKERKLPSAN